MNLDELQSVQARERQSSDLQHLRASFYKEVGQFISDLTEERAHIVESAEDPFSEPDVRRLTDDIETAESTVEAIYERRVGKVVKKASIAAAGMPVENDGLTSEEQTLFEDLVDRIEENRETVLSVLEGEGSSLSVSLDETGEQGIGEDQPETPDTTEGDGDASTAEADESVADENALSAADLMAGSPPTDTPPEELEAGGSESDRPSHEAVPPGSPPVEDEGSREAPEAATESSEGATDVPGIPRTTVRITADVGEIVGADDRDYDLGSEDVVTLPTPNADVLVDKNAAERL